MATRRRHPPKKQPPTPPPPDESSEDEGGESGEEESKSEQEQLTPNGPRSAAVALTVPASPSPAAASGDDKDDDDEEDESAEADSETEEEEQASERPVSRSATTGKPSSENPVPEPGKNSGTAKESARKAYQRIWSDEDQTTLLKGMVDYITNQGEDPVANIESFWLFIRKKLSFPVTEWQLMWKIRAVKEKYRQNLKKGRAFSKSLGAEVFELSKKVWGAGGKSTVTENGGGKTRKSSRLEAVENCGNDEAADDGLEWENETVDLSMKHNDRSKDLARAEVKAMPEPERKLIMQRWKKLKREEVSNLAHRRSLALDTMKAIF